MKLTKVVDLLSFLEFNCNTGLLYLFNNWFETSFTT